MLLSCANLLSSGCRTRALFLSASECNRQSSPQQCPLYPDVSMCWHFVSVCVFMYERAQQQNFKNVFTHLFNLQIFHMKGAQCVSGHDHLLEQTHLHDAVRLHAILWPVHVTFALREGERKKRKHSKLAQVQSHRHTHSEYISVVVLYIEIYTGNIIISSSRVT